MAQSYEDILEMNITAKSIADAREKALEEAKQGR